METDNLLTAEEDDNVSTSSDDVTKEAESQHIRKPLRVAITAVMALGYICMVSKLRNNHKILFT